MGSQESKASKGFRVYDLPEELPSLGYIFKLGLDIVFEQFALAERIDMKASVLFAFVSVMLAGLIAAIVGGKIPHQFAWFFVGGIMALITALGCLLLAFRTRPFKWPVNYARLVGLARHEEKKVQWNTLHALGVAKKTNDRLLTRKLWWHGLAGLILFATIGFLAVLGCVILLVCG